MFRLCMVLSSILSSAVIAATNYRTIVIASTAFSPQQQSRQTVLSAGEQSQTAARVREKLADHVTLEFVEAPLSDVIDFLRDYTQLNIMLDRPALQQVGMTDDTPVSIHVQAIKMESALNQLLRQHGLTWVVKDECLIITSNSVADQFMVTRSYPIDDLAATPDDAAKLIAVATQVLAWSGRASAQRLIHLDPLKALVLTDNRSSHALMERLLQQLRSGANEPDTVKKIKVKLADPVTLEFVETPLSDVVDFLKDYTGVNIVYDRAALEDVGVTPDNTISIHAQSIELRSALSLLLGAYKLTMRIEDECLVITSKEAEQGQFDLRVYAVGKLLAGGPQMSPEDWKRLIGSIAVPELSLTRPLFAAGSRVLVRWADNEFTATVLGLTQSTYHVRFRVGNEEREEWIDSSQVQGPLQKNANMRPLIEYYEPSQSLIVLAPCSLQDKVEETIGLVMKTADRTKGQKNVQPGK